MSTSAISSYLTSYSANATSSTQSTSDTDENTLDMSDFITLLVAQLQNQDMYNTTDTSEFMSQMAQYSMVEAINEMKEQNEISSSFGLIGKGVTVSNDTSSDTGVVDGVTLTNGVAQVVVNGTEYSLSDIAEIFDASLLDSE